MTTQQPTREQVVQTFLNTNEASNNMFKEQQDRAHNAGISKLTEMVRDAQKSARADLEATIADLTQQVDFWQKECKELQFKDDATIAEQAAEIERLAKSAYVGEHQFDDCTWKYRHDELRQQLLESQAREAKLREYANDAKSAYGWDEVPSAIHIHLDDIFRTLALPADDTALREALAKELEDLAGRPEACAWPNDVLLAIAHRAIAIRARADKEGS